MKTRISDQVGFGLLLLVMLAIAFVASEAASKGRQAPTAAEPAIATQPVVDLSIGLEYGVDASTALLTEDIDVNNARVQ